MPPCAFLQKLFKYFTFCFSGTERQHVTDDYAKRLHIGEVECRQVISAALNDMMTTKNNAAKMDLKFCEYLNISACPTSESGNVCFV